ncbi:MAG TPA: hypothetical protein VEL76_38820, partial [Gemmataceae bacterium]|nr:hypothetical protein [Gemmataceae bacterium]
SILQTFAAPKGKVSREALNQKIDATTTALLGLTGISADPVQSREHILIAQLLLNTWSKGKDLDLAGLITQIQEPPLSKIGAFDIDTFYPEKDRLKLAVALNNILAAPSFSTWIQGEPLDLSKLLASPTKKKRHLIFYVAHLDDAQRMFFITLLLEEVLSWTRKQPGTTSLRAILYFDEVFGYLPPYPANPPSKLPLMTLLKQARAFGVGVLLATQNPVDLDYKALSNAGTWFVGKLQTERDKARLVEGLEGVAAASGTLTNRAYLETVISALGNRVFLLHDVHRGAPVLFQSRHVLSYLRGPMTREQIETLMAPLKEAAAQDHPPASAPAAPTPAAAVPVAPVPVAAILLCRRCLAELPPGVAACPKCGEPLQAASRGEARHPTQTAQTPASTTAIPVVPVEVAVVAPPSVPGDVPQFYLPLAGAARSPGGPQYQARVLGVADVSFFDKKRGISHRQTYRLLALPPAVGQPVAWHTAERLTCQPTTAPGSAGTYGAVPESLNTGKKVKSLEKTLAEFVYDNTRLVWFENEALNLLSQPGEDVTTFRDRCRAAARVELDKAIAAERLRYQPKFDALGARMPDAATGPNVGSVLGALNPFGWFGGKEPPKPLPGDKIAKLEAEWREKQAAIYEKWKQAGEQCNDVPLKPRRQDVQVTTLGLAWAPFWQVQTHPGRLEWVPAYR